MKSHHQLAIFEAGISKPGEMDNLKKMIQPTIGIFTNIGHAHDENFHNPEQKITEKLKLFSDTKTLIYCQDNKEIHDQIRKSDMPDSMIFFTWGFNDNANLLIQEIKSTEVSTTITAAYYESTISINIPFTDSASIENAIHCWATLLFLGYSNEMIASKINRLTPIAMRLELKEGVNNCSLINDSYSSDLDSLSIALDFLNQQKQHAKKTVILSDILQSGKLKNILYTDVAELLKNKHIDRIIGIGRSISKYSSRFEMEKEFFTSTQDFLNKYSLSMFQNESILLKGARVFEFEKISNLLQQKTHETVLEINLNALVNNLNFYRSLLDKSTKIMVMVKAFSYGSGSFEISNILQFHDVDYLAVAYADEGIELRKAGISLPIMVMNPDAQSFEALLQNNLEPEIYNFRILALFYVLRI